MAIELEGKTIETTPTGYLVDIADWSEELAKTYRRRRGCRVNRKALGFDELFA